jgi:hypothetical protein
MSKAKTLGSAMAVALLVGALSSVGAVALPSYFHCGEVMSGGKFSTAENCEVLAEGTGAWALREVLSGEKFSQPATGGSATLETVKKEKLMCTSSKTTGKTNGPQANSEVVVAFEKCTGPLGAECKSPAAKAGVIETFLLKGRLGYIKMSPLEVGVLLEPESTAIDSEFTCKLIGIESTLKVRGGLICKVTPLNVMTTSAGKGKIECTQTAGKQTTLKFLGEEENHTLETEAKGSLVSFAYEQSAEANSQTLTTIGEELKA